VGKYAGLLGLGEPDRYTSVNKVLDDVRFVGDCTSQRMTLLRGHIFVACKFPNNRVNRGPRDNNVGTRLHRTPSDRRSSSRNRDGLTRYVYLFRVKGRLHVWDSWYGTSLFCHPTPSSSPQTVNTSPSTTFQSHPLHLHLKK